MSVSSAGKIFKSLKTLAINTPAAKNVTHLIRFLGRLRETSKVLASDWTAESNLSILRLTICKDLCSICP